MHIAAESLQPQNMGPSPKENPNILVGPARFERATT